jgi:hemolysin III
MISFVSLKEFKEWDKHNLILSDGGPVYAETNLRFLIVEPWNSISSLTFLIPAIWLMSKIEWKIKEYPFLSFCAFLLSLGGFGSAIFHGFRVSPLFIFLDVFPIIILNIAISIFFWYKVLQSIIKILGIVLIMIISRLTIQWLQISNHDKINFGYFISGIFIFVPIAILLIKTKGYQGLWIFLGFFSLLIALFFRKIDALDPPLFSIGTHWLWHIFCSSGAFFIAKYTLYIYQSSLNGKLEKIS